MIDRFMMPKVFPSLSMVAAVVMGLIASPHSSEAHIFPARGGSSSFYSDANCWSPNGPSMTNICNSARYWYIPLIDTGSGWITVTAQGASNSSNVSCFTSGWYKSGDYYYSSGSYNLPQFGPSVDINMPLFVPGGGTGMVDCLVYPGGKVVQATW